MDIECMHKTLKCTYLQGKHAKRLDKTIHVIRKFIPDRSVDRLAVYAQRKTKIKIIRNTNAS